MENTDFQSLPAYFYKPWNYLLSLISQHLKFLFLCQNSEEKHFNSNTSVQAGITSENFIKTLYGNLANCLTFTLSCHDQLRCSHAVISNNHNNRALLKGHAAKYKELRYSCCEGQHRKNPCSSLISRYCVRISSWMMIRWIINQQVQI